MNEQPMDDLDPLERFTNRVQDYRRTRPGYPPSLIGLLERKLALTTADVIADIGSGTGLLAELFLKNGNPVFGVEPNRAMRAAGEENLRRYPHFTSVAASAESTNLPTASIDLVVVGQAFHWFDRNAARSEFTRILRTPRRAALIWNERAIDASDFLAEYEALLRRYSTEYDRLPHRNLGHGIVEDFFAPGWSHTELHNSQSLDLEGLRGRLLSTSYVPRQPGPQLDAMLLELAELFTRHERDGRIEILYRTIVYHGHLAS